MWLYSASGSCGLLMLYWNMKTSRCYLTLGLDRQTHRQQKDRQFSGDHSEVLAQQGSCSTAVQIRYLQHSHGDSTVLHWRPGQSVEDRQTSEPVGGSNGWGQRTEREG